MKGSVFSSRGEIPKRAPRLLPDGFAQKAVNARILSGDLTAWKVPTSISTLTPTSAAIKSIYRMQTQLSGADIFLRSLNDVNWARGPIAGDTNETILFTNFPDNPTTGGSLSAGTAQPKITQFGLATGAAIHANQTAGNYPNDWRLLGTPTPSATPAVSAIPIAVGSPVTFSDGTSTTPWTTKTNLSVDAAGVIGFGANTDLLLTDAGNCSADITVGKTAGDSVQFILHPVGASKDFLIRLGCDSSGNGVILKLTTSATNQNTGSVGGTNAFYSLGTATTFGGAPTYTSNGVIPPYVSGNTYNSRYTAVGNTVVQLSLSVNPTGGTNLSMIVGTLNTTPLGGPPVMVNSTTVFTTLASFNGTFFEFRTSGQNVYFKNVITQSSASTLDVVSTSYVYTWVNQFGGESAPSPSSDLTLFSTGLTTTVTNINDPVDPDKTNYGLTSAGFGTKNLYRAATGATGLTQFFFVATIPYGTTSYVDTIPTAQLGSTLQTADWHLPPNDGFNVLALPNGITVMASKNQVCPSVIAQPHSYPLDFRLTTDFPIVGMGSIDTTVVVLTQANPYIVQGSDPSQLSMAKIELPYGCVSKRSIAHLKGYGIVYASANGLVAINGAGAQLITNDFFTREQWQAIKPSSIVAWVNDDRYFFTYTLGS